MVFEYFFCFRLKLLVDNGVFCWGWWHAFQSNCAFASQKVATRVDDSNFLAWKQHTLLVTKTHRLQSYIDGTIAVPRRLIPVILRRWLRILLLFNVNNRMLLCQHGFCLLLIQCCTIGWLVILPLPLHYGRHWLGFLGISPQQKPCSIV